MLMPEQSLAVDAVFMHQTVLEIKIFKQKLTIEISYIFNSEKI